MADYLNEPLPEPKKEVKALRPMSPAQAKKEHAAIEELYESGDAKVYTPEWKQRALARINFQCELWAKEKVG